MSDRVLIHDAQQSEWLDFQRPRCVLVANRPDEVIETLDQVENRVLRDGLFAAGFLAYEAAPAFDPALAVRARTEFPLAWFALYDSVGRSVAPGRTHRKGYQVSGWEPSIDRPAYRRAFERVRDYLRAGDTYQVNFSYRLRCRFRGDPRSYFADLSHAQQGRYAAFVQTGRWTICSASPELFFSLDRGKLVSRPMKGTAPRGLTLEDDAGRGERLARCEKNRAENVMITDMVRNDMGRVARIGSVRARDLFRVEKYPTVWQMTSTVECLTEAGVSRILGALFPAASITGAPKLRTTQIIAEIECSPRRIYTGTVGFLTPGGRAQFNVAIRTVLIDGERGEAEYGVGGGIVWDSDENDESRECLVKARILRPSQPEFSLLETMLWTPRDGYFLLRHHLKRLEDSAAYFSFPFDPKHARTTLASISRSFLERSFRVRLLLSRSGRIECEHVPLGNGDEQHSLHVKPATAPVDSTDPFLYHKTTNRAVYENALKSQPQCDDVILWNERGEITEATTANIVIELDGRLWTPPVSSGLLAGTYRSLLLEQGEVGERVVRVADLKRASRLYLVNSVRRMRHATLGRATPHEPGRHDASAVRS